MWVIKIVVNAFALFIIPTLILTLYSALHSSINGSKATGLGVVKGYGPFFALTGLFYVALGVFLWSPLPEMLMRHLMLKHLKVG